MNMQRTLIYFLSRKSSRFSANTLSTYENCLSNFIESTDNELSEIVIDDYLDWERKQLNSGKERSTLSFNRAACKAFINFAIEEELLASNPLIGLKRMKLKKAIPRYLDDMTIGVCQASCRQTPKL